MRNILMVGAGGFLGAVMRYAASAAIQRFSPAAFFPLGTLGVNVAGCLAIGYLGGWSDHARVFSTGARLFLFLGVLGGFTTFSTFGHETVSLMRNGQVVSSFLNVTLHVGVGLFAVWLGYGLSNLA